GQVVMAAVEGRTFAPTRASDPTANFPPVLLTVREDGRVVLATTVGANVSDYHFALAQLTPAGLPDLTFGGGDGFVVTTRFVAGASSVALAPGGKIVVAGTRGGVGSTGTVYLARYTAAGAPDEVAFTSAGYFTVSSTGTGPVVAVAPDGAITVGMTTPAGAAPGADFLLYRVLSDGQPDRTFTGDGRADFGGADDALRA